MVRKRHCKFYPVGCWHCGPVQAKTSARKNATESISFKNPVLCRLLCAVLEDKNDNDYLHTPREFRSLLKAFGLQGKFHPDSLRRGGATWHFHANTSIDATIVQGRWQHHETARIYIEDAVAAEVALSLPPDAVQGINNASQLWAAWLSEWKFGT